MIASAGARVAVVACAAYPALDDDWPPLRQALARRGIEARAEVWTDRQVDWSAFDLVVVRGAWDNIRRPDDFLAWARRVQAVATLVNDAEAMTWNMDKRYLADLAGAGIATVSTTWVAPGGAWEPPGEPTAPEIVVKPTISGGGVDTARYPADQIDLARAHVDRLGDAGRTAMIQPYLPSVDALGETALIYLGGVFSHAVTKAALLRSGEGITERLWEREVITAVDPPPGERVAADAAMAAAATWVGRPTYARVDLVRDAGGTPCVLELELIDPCLFLGFGAGSAERFAEVLAALVARRD